MKVVSLIFLVVVSYSTFSQNILPKSEIVFIDTKESLNEQLEQFDNKFVFLDIWSVNCSPCIEQFRYLRELEDYFENNEIVILSLCVNPEYNIDRWKELINEYNVKGYHVFISSSVIRSFKQGFDIDEKYLIRLGHNFPLYILIGMNGIANKLDYLPSEKEKLIEQINNYLN